MGARRRRELATAITTALVCCVFAAVASSAGTTPGSLLAFGNNYWGQLGSSTNNGSATANPTPTSVNLPAEVGRVTRAAAGGSFSLVATSGGQLYAFGEDQYGQLGSSADSNAHPTPAVVNLPAQSGSVVDLAAGIDHSLVATASGQLYAFGDNNYGQLGTSANSGTLTPNPAPVLLPSFAGQVGQVTHLAAGLSFSLVLTSSGQLYAFGDNQYGQLGSTADNNPHPTPTPVSIPGGQVTAIAAGGHHTLAATSSGQLYAFGLNIAGDLGNSNNVNTFNANPTPTLVGLPGQSGVVTELAAGEDFSLALTSSGQLYGFGGNDFGQLGFTQDVNTHATPILVTLPGQVGQITQIAASQETSFATTSSGQLYAFGRNDNGQAGVSGGGNVTTPTVVSLPAGTTIDDVARGPEAVHTLALVGDLAVATTSLPGGVVGSPYSVTLQALGGITPLAWAVSGLPGGLHVDSTTGAIAGTPSAAGTSTATVTVTDADGLVASAQLPLTVAPAGQQPGGQQPGAAPALTNLRVVPKSVIAADRGATITRKRKTGATISYTDSEAATTTFTVFELGRGVKLGNRCVVPRRQRGKRCALHLKLGTFTHADRAGANSLHFSGRLGGHKLKPGSYQLQAVPTAGSLQGRAVSTRFSVVVSRR